MISFDLKNPSPIISTLQTNRFKPCFPHYRQVFESLSGSLQKRYDKHIHGLSLKPKNESFFKRIPMPKTLRSLNIDSWQSGQNLTFVKKLVKPYIKYIKNAQGSLKNQKIQKLLPLLTGIDVGLTQDSLQILSLNKSFKKLQFQFDAYPMNNGEEFLMKCKAQSSRSLMRVKGLKEINVAISREQLRAANLMLEIINENLCLDSLEECIFGLISRESSQKLFQKVNIGKILGKLTHVFTDDLEWYFFLISSGNLTSLSDLYLSIISGKISKDCIDFLHFDKLPRLKKLTLKLSARSLTSERDFFENFTLPPSMEDLDLALADFNLSEKENSYSHAQFFKHLQEAKGVKTLNLELTKNAANSTSHNKFVCLMIKCFANLETLRYVQLKDFFSFYHRNDQLEPLDFQEFWAAVTPSKETLQSISVNDSTIVFPEGLHTTLETVLPKLQKLELSSRISSAAELGRFCQKIPSLKDITLDSVQVSDEEGLKTFLDSMKYIPEGAKFELHLSVCDIQQWPLLDCLRIYIEDVKVRGQLGVYFTGVQVEDPEAFEMILELAQEKGSFDPFRMTNSDSYQSFCVKKTALIESSG